MFYHLYARLNVNIFQYLQRLAPTTERMFIIIKPNS